MEPGGALSEQDAERVRRAHIGLRKASQDLEAYTAPVAMRGRWDPAPVPDEALAGARTDLQRAYASLWSLYAELLGWPPPPLPLPST